MMFLLLPETTVNPGQFLLSKVKLIIPFLENRCQKPAPGDCRTFTYSFTQAATGQACIKSALIRTSARGDRGSPVDIAL